MYQSVKGRVDLTSLTLVWLRWAAYVLLLALVVTVTMIISQLIRARRAPYYAMREDALKQVRLWMLVALILLVLAIDLLIVPPRLATIIAPPTPTPTVFPTVTLTFTPISSPTGTPTVAPTRRPSATPPFIPTSTPDVPPPESALTPLPSAVPAGEDARITIITLAADEDDSGQPVNPGAEFPPGDHPVYLFVSYEGMVNGVVWTFAIYREGEFLDGVTQLWEWGIEGRTSLYYEPPGGYEPGIYEMRVFIEDRLQGVAQFVIAEE